MNSESILLGGYIWNQGLKWLHNTRPEWFSIPDYSMICETLQRMSRENIHIEMTSTIRECPMVKPEVILKIHTEYSGQEVSYHWAKVRQDWTGRHGKKVFADLSMMFDEPDPYAVIKKALFELDKMQLTEAGQSLPIHDLVSQRTNNLDHRRHLDIKTVGHPSGYAALDKYIGGFVPGEMIVVAGRPGMGKTAFAFCIALAHAKLGGSVVMFSLEMSKEQIGDRGLAILGQVDNLRIRAANVSDREFERIKGNLDTWKLDFEVDTTTGITIDQIRARVKCMKKRPTLVIVDYLQLVTSNNSKVREQQISYVSRQCKLISKDSSCTVMALSQLNRESENRGDNRPKISDLRESGAIEQDADTVIFPYRPQYYVKKQKDLPEVETDCELHIAKCRNGMTGKLPIQFRGETVEYLW